MKSRYDMDGRPHRRRRCWTCGFPAYVVGPFRVCRNLDCDRLVAA